MSAVNLYFNLKKRGKKDRILVMTYNVAVSNFIDDAIRKIITYESTEEKENKDIDIHVFTVDGLKEHLKKKIRGKIIARNRYRWGSTPLLEDTPRRRYRSGSTALLGDTPTPTLHDSTPTLHDSTPTVGESTPSLWEEPEDFTEERLPNDNETFQDIFYRYSDPDTGVSKKTLLDNFGYCGIFIDEVSHFIY